MQILLHITFTGNWKPISIASCMDRGQMVNMEVMAANVVKDTYYAVALDLAHASYQGH